MKPARLTMTILIWLMLSCALLTSVALPGAHAESGGIVLDHWSVHSIASGEEAGSVPPEGGWEPGDAAHARTALPSGDQGVWLKLDVPPTAEWHRPGLLAERLYGLDVSVYEGGRLLQESKRGSGFERGRLLLPLDAKPDPDVLYVRILSGKRAGIDGDVRIGEFGTLSDEYIRKGLPDLLLGSAIAAAGLIMLICSGYMNKRRRAAWISLSLVALSAGCLFFCYSQLPYILFPGLGRFFLVLFDVSLVVLFPAINAYVGQVFEGRYRSFAIFAKAQAGYSAACAGIVVFYYATGERYTSLYILFTVTLLGLLVLVQMLWILALSLRNAFRGERDAILLSLGLFALALSGVLDLTFYYVSRFEYVLFLWKFGIVGMILLLILLFARRISADYTTLVSYSKELELYNHRLQHSEKVKIISDLAASVAHEVRNPLQVTRGFLQLLSLSPGEKEAAYIRMAMQELDRASTIITDFLTFAKPELDEIERIDIGEELRRVERIIQPLAAMYGASLDLRLDGPVWIMGHSSKLKQALINIVKNSLEALGEDGQIRIEAHIENHAAIVRIADNGEGMEEEQLAKLGEPYFSTKTKGTGLGLMVTFRIIEAMKGTLEFRSRKGEGTEAIARFPLAEGDD